MHSYRSHKRQLYISIFLIILIVIGMGYAYLSSNLSITGATSVTGNNWDIHFANIQISNGSVPIGTGKQAATIDSQDNTLITFSVLFEKPGDYYEFTADIVNGGTLDGMIDTIEQKVNNQAISNLPSYIEYSLTYLDEEEIEPNHLLEAGETETIKVRVRYKKNIANNELVGTNTSLTFSINLSYLQSDENAIVRPQPTYIYRNDDVESVVGQTVSLTGTYYTTEEEMLSHTTNPFFLRHTVGSDNIIKDSYIGIYVNNTVYYIRGGGSTYDPISDIYDNTFVKYDEYKPVMLAAFADGYCGDYDANSIACQGSIGFSYYNNVGDLNVNNTILNCRISNLGWSNCIPN